MQLSKRLQAVSALVSSGNRLVDVGCDHGYLPVFLVEKGRTPSALALDVRVGPLSRAEGHIAEHHLQDKIKTRLSDGLKAVEAGEGDTLVLAGMGGLLTIKILSESLEKLSSFQEIILQPQSDIDMVRRFVRQQGWETEGEDMVLEDGKFYPMMRLVYKGALPAWREDEYRFGKALLSARHPVLMEFLEKEAALKESIMERLEKENTAGARARLEEIKEDYAMIQEALDERNQS